MSVTITQLPDSAGEEWNKYVDRAKYTSPFHRHEALDLIGRSVDATPYRLVGFVGEEPIGILPVFSRTQGPFRYVVSPPELELFSLGPALLNFEKLKQRKAERRHVEFIEASLDWIDGLDPDYVDIRGVDRYGDVRGFIWNGFDVSPAYTYILDLTMDESELLASFSRDARTNIKGAADDGVTVTEGTEESIGPIIDSIADRLDSQGVSYPLTSRFVERLYSRLPDGTVRVYLATVDDDVRSGMITLEWNDTIYRWQGGAKVGETPEINDFLDWSIIQRAKECGYTRYDLVGANSPRLTRYKSKFDPTPAPYFVAKKRSTRLRVATALYHRIPDRFRRF